MIRLSAVLFAALATAILTGCDAGAPTAALGDGATFSVRPVRPSSAATPKAAASAKAVAKATPAEKPAPDAGAVPVRAQLAITAAAGYRLQTLTAYNTTDIDHVTLTLYKDDGTGTYASTGVTKNVTQANLGTAVSLGNLRSDTGYKIVARAYEDAEEATQIDNIASTGVTTDCAVTFTTPAKVTATTGNTIDDAAVSVSVPLKLKDKTFAGTASAASGIVVTNGDLVDTTSTETF